MTALSPLAQHGLRLFRGRARCARCHSGSNLTDEDFHNIGVSWAHRPYDAGRAVVTGVPEDTGKFKTPTLREIARTAPYMHDGSIASLEGVIEFYDRGGNDNPFRDRGAPTAVSHGGRATGPPGFSGEPERGDSRRSGVTRGWPNSSSSIGRRLSPVELSVQEDVAVSPCGRN